MSDTITMALLWLALAGLLPTIVMFCWIVWAVISDKIFQRKGQDR